MSVVNKMLQDLEQRDDSSNGVSADYRPPAQKSKLIARLAYLGLAIGLVMLSVAGGYFWQANRADIQGATESNIAPQITQSTGKQPTIASPVNQSINESTDESKSETALTAHTPAKIMQTPVVTQHSAEQLEDEQEEFDPDTSANATSTEQNTDADKQNQGSELALATPTQSSMSVTSHDPLTIRDPRAEAQLALQSGDNKGAIKALLELITQTPENHKARKKLASLLFADGQSQSAEQVLRDGIALNEHQADLRLMLARLYINRNRTQQAYELLQSQSVYALNQSDYVALRANLAEQLGQHQQAFSDYLSLAQAFPEQARWWLGFAIAAERSQDFPSATAAYERALSLEQLSNEVASFARERLRFLRAQS